jgi:hypothetical protein
MLASKVVGCCMNEKLLGICITKRSAVLSLMQVVSTGSRIS